MTKALSLALVVAGLLLILVTLLFYTTAAPPDEPGLPQGTAPAPLWLAFAGAVGVVAAAGGLLGLLRSFRGYTRAFSKTTNSMTE